MEAQVTDSRPRDREATRQRLLAAARALFGEYGYEQVTVRMIASAAEANISLVGRYFGSKAGLFGEVVANEPTIRRIVDGEPAGLARRMAGFAAERMHHDPESPVLRTLERSLGNPDIQALVRDRLRSAVIDPLAAQLDGPDAHGRAWTATAFFLGVGAMRRVMGPESPTPADIDRFTAMFELCLGKTIQR
jgi:AcrR family transcriptional regulator